MQNEKITDPLVLHLIETVEFIGQAWIDRRASGPWHEVDEVDHRRLDQKDAGGFERLEKAARQSYGHAIANPGLVAPAGRKPQQTGLCLRRSLEPAQQGNLRITLLDELAGKNITITGAMLEWNAPLPSGP